jgi:hypothetical protein
MQYLPLFGVVGTPFVGVKIGNEFAVYALRF